MRYFIELAYKGTNYHGWQKQLNAPSVQQTLENALSIYLREDVSTIGAGRTDAGVHANYFIAHVDLVSPISSIPRAIYRVNSILPEDIAISGITSVSDDAHARFDALEREYKYYICNHKNPFKREFAWQYHSELNVQNMNKAASYLLNAEDFTTFSKLHSGNKTNICDVTHAHWESIDGGYIFTIRANRFLRNMVRSLVSSLVDVGRGKINTDYFKEILELKDRSLATGTAPAEGLFVNNVVYPQSVFKK